MITIKNENDIKLLRKGGKILSSVLREVSGLVEPGVDTMQLENLACELIKKAGGRPAFKYYKTHKKAKPFPTALCTSINNEIVHAPAIPARELKNGDIVGIDVGMEWPAKNGRYTDMSVTVIVGKVDENIQKLLKVTKESLKRAIAQVKQGNTLNDIGKAVENYVKPNGYGIVRDLVGHGVGYAVHEDPQVPNFDISNGEMENFTLKSGMVIAIEPMVNMGGWQIEVLDDGFTIVTADGSLSAHFEHTILVTENGCEVITK
ncbi:type I methionyl aminopeptidase [Candidatus Parcubacteria bacterium]|nr:type I methionyl aminopeptidase [Candidatus Parcubacteria bacterium]